MTTSSDNPILRVGDGQIKKGMGRGAGPASPRKRLAAQLNPIKHGARVHSVENRDKPRSQLMMEKALLSQGVSADQVNQLAAHVLHNLHRTGELLENELSFSTSGQYTKLALDVTKGLRELVPEDKSVAVDTTSIALAFLREEGRDDLASKLALRFAQLQPYGTSKNVNAVPELHGREESPETNGPVQDSRD